MIIKVPLEANYTQMPNALLHDPDLSFDAVTVLMRLLAMPADWKVCLQSLRRRWKCGLERLKRIMNELIAAGWAQRQPSRRLANGSYSGGDYKIFNVRQEVQTVLPLDAGDETEASAEDQATVGAARESVEPESVKRTPNKDSKETNKPPVPPRRGGSPRIDLDSEDRAVETAGSTRQSRWRGKSSKGCRRAEPPAVPTETLSRFHQLLNAYPPSGRLGADKAQALAAFAALPDRDQVAAIGAAGTEARIRAEHRSQARALHRWLERGLWRNGVISADGANPSEARNAAGLEAVRRGEWPIGCTHLVLADTPAGDAWEAHFARFGVRPRWMQLTAGLGAFMPTPIPPPAGTM